VTDKDKLSDKGMMGILNDMIQDLINAQRPSWGEDKGPGVRDACSYPFIPQANYRLIPTFYALRKKLPKIKGWVGNRKDFGNLKFLDAGCGIGNVMVTARACGLAGHYHGIEYFDKTYERAQNWLGLDHQQRSRYKVFKDDILKFQKYGDYDIIYYYCPFSDGELQRKFEEYLEDEMKVGAVLVAFLKQSRTITKDYRFRRVDGIPGADCVFLKTKKGPREISNVTPDKALVAHAIRPSTRDVYVEKYGMK